MKRIPRIKFPQRRPKPSVSSKKKDDYSPDSTSHPQEASANKDHVRKFFSRPPSSMSTGGKASDQPKRTPVSQEEIEAIMLGGSF